LCLLALNRPKDAEQSLERLAMTRPLFTLDGADASPKLVALFQDVRKRTLPEASRQFYQRARASFESGDMAEGSAAIQRRDRHGGSSRQYSDDGRPEDGVGRFPETRSGGIGTEAGRSRDTRRAGGRDAGSGGAGRHPGRRQPRRTSYQPQ
jgi:hypothetical protein